ncbi:hypothetical protein [Neptunicella marina]|uniref:Uncharacterized protein n=1 Tax=Neptunicella marina TaxID=2125989 RepID=A0A8J6IQS6_9ALTE|nr:hypothetical protein [Neptunicella marina]MBC3764699.1 hypothetical protein [Neptunicella marina]
MILRRLSHHLKQQNWFAVLLDFIIVVAGVFIGVQVSHWQEVDNQKALYEDAFKRATAELVSNIEHIQKVQNYYRERLPKVQTAISALRSCGQEGGDHTTVEATFPLIMNYSRIFLSARDVDLLLNNDDFLAFQPSELRKGLLDISMYLHFYDNELAQKMEEGYSTDFLKVLKTGPLVGSPDDNIQAIKNGTPGSPELVRKHTLGVPITEACKMDVLLRKYYSWEEAVYFQIVVSQRVVEYLRERLAFLKTYSEKG